MKKKILVATTLLTLATAAQAGFITIDNVTPDDTTIGIVNNSEFKGTLAGLGIGTYTLGASLGLDTAGSISYSYYGKEAGYSNTFTSGGTSFSTGHTPQTQNHFGSPLQIGTVAVGAGSLDFNFCAYSSGSWLVGCVNNAQNDTLGLNSLQSIAFNITDNTAWIFWDDSGSGPDDDHDDMLIKAVFTATSVPEPGSLALLGLGLIGLAAGRRARAKAASR